MSALKDLQRSAEAIFTKVGTLQEQLRVIPNARSTFSVENGMEYCTNTELSRTLVRAAKKSPSFRGDQTAKNIESLAQVLAKCTKNLQDCENVVGRAMQAYSWSPNLEEEVSTSWRLFSMHLLEASMILEVKELDLFMLIGKPEMSTVNKREIIFLRISAEQSAEQET